MVVVRARVLEGASQGRSRVKTCNSIVSEFMNLLGLCKAEKMQLHLGWNLGADGLEAEMNLSSVERHHSAHRKIGVTPLGEVACCITHALRRPSLDHTE